MYRIHKLAFVALLVIFSHSLVFSTALGQTETIRFCNWNMLDYPDKWDSGFEPEAYYRLVLREIDPDILCVQEVDTDEGQNQILSDVLEVNDPGEWSTSPNTDSIFGSGYWLDDAHIYYKQDKITLLDWDYIRTDLRYIKMFKLGIDNGSGSDLLYVFTTHLKASSGTDEQNQRASEVQDLLDYLTENAQEFDRQPIIFCGDFNFYTSSEPGFQLLIENNTFLDPIDRIGSWNNNSSFEDVHTQSTRSSSLSDGGSSGGLDDRFDFILINSEMLDGRGMDALPETYQAFGNDGNHFNQSINYGTNAVVSAEIANALYYASDHLPVVMNLVHDYTSGIDEIASLLPTSFRIVRTFPNPFNARTTVELDLLKASTLGVQLYDVSGRLVLEVQAEGFSAGTHRVSIDAGALSSGIYLLQVRNNSGEMESRKIVLIR